MPPEVDALPSVLTKCVTHPCWMVVLFATPVSWGSLPVKFLPVAALTPLPASGFQGSVAVCAPYFFTEKPSSVVRPGPRFARLSSMGMVIRGSAPLFAERVVATNASAEPLGVPGPSGYVSKYQSLSAECASICQLKREVAFPPHRLSGALSAA